ncbi:MAG TPA: FkbM family methyltransferase [Burkholderiaceae bacterium]|nr:FkbM family methyltransferase [Burkholderiaceae bacterium]
MNRIHAGDLVIDVGAHIGEKAQGYVDQGATVVCIEPQPACAAQLRHRFAQTPNVHVLECGLSDKAGELELAVCDDAPTISSFAKHWQQGRFKGYVWNRNLRVPVITLDDLIGRFGAPAYVKIDVEGYEAQVLAGLSRRVGVVSFEFAQEFRGDAERCIGQLATLGYQRFNLSRAEDDHFLFSRPLEQHEFVPMFRQFCSLSSDSWGDIYAA